MGICILAITRPFFGQIQKSKYPCTQENDIYRLSTINRGYDVSFTVLAFLAKKWAWPPRWRLRVWGLKTQRKTWHTGWTFWVNGYLEIMFSKFLAWTPLPNCKKFTFSILAFLITSLGNILHYFYPNFLIYVLCVQDNRILHGKENQVILHWDIQAQNWQNWRFSAILMIFANFDYFGRGPPCATFWESFQKPFYATI